MTKNIYWQGFLGALLSTAMFAVSCSEAGSETKASQSPSIAQSQDAQWQPMSEEEKQRAIDSVINQPLGIAALNQLAIEGFVGADCNRSFYTDQKTGFRILMQVKCSSPRGVSIALGYDEVRITFSLFEDNIENFTVDRVHAENRDRVTPLPD
jgi:hypothetical protein